MWPYLWKGVRNMQEKRLIMIIGAGVFQLPAILTAKKMGLQVAAIDKDPEAPGFSYADIYAAVSTIDIEAALAKAREWKPQGVMTLASDAPVRTVAAIARELGLNAVSEATAACATNKGKMRLRFKEYGVPIPEFSTVSSLDEYLNTVCSFQLPFIVKPADNSGSRGVFLVNRAEDIDEAYEYSRQHSRSGEVLVEEYMTGPEVSVESLTVNGITHVVAVTDKCTTGAPFFVEMGHSLPSRLPPDILKAIERTACAAVNAIGIENGASHTEIIVTGNGPRIVELGARLGGDCITTHLVPMATGIDMVKGCIQIAMGEEPDLLPKWRKGAAIRYVPCREGELIRIDAEEARSLEGVRLVMFEKKIGDRITAVQSSDDRAGFVIAQAKTASMAEEICRQAADCIKLAIYP